MTPLFPAAFTGPAGGLRSHAARLLVAFACALSAACTSPEPPVLGQVAPFQLVGHDGAPISNTRFEGQPWLASFFYTTCAGPCPRLIARLKRLRTEIEPASLAFVSISVDPAVDTPPVLADYRRTRGITDADAWTFVTGPPEDVLTLVEKGFLTAVERADPASAEGAVTHGVRVVLVDGQGRIRGYYSPESDEDLLRLAGDVRSLKRR